MLVAYEFEEVGGGELIRSRFEARPPGVWRYLELLPGLSAEPVSMGEGGTALVRAERLGRFIGVRRLLLKNESTNPTGSFLDRGASLEVTSALSASAPSVTCIAPGNLGVSAAAYSARAELPCKIYFRPGVEQAKILQALAYDAEVSFLRGSEGMGETGDYPITPSNPLLLEGVKTLMLEVLEKLGWRAPDWFFLSVGSGGLMTAAWKAVKEAEELGLLRDGAPRMFGAQVDGCAPLVEALKGGRRGCGETVFPDISVENPARGETALKAVKESGGDMAAVSEEEVLDAMRILAKTEGVLVEPAAATALAAIIKAVREGVVGRDEEVVYVVTGSGLKDPVTTRSILSRPRVFPGHVDGTKRMILEVLSEGGLHGYGVWRTLMERYGLRVSLPTIYQHLEELSSFGFIHSAPPERGRSGRIVRRYFLTERGRRALGID